MNDSTSDKGHGSVLSGAGLAGLVLVGVAVVGLIFMLIGL